MHTQWSDLHLQLRHQELQRAAVHHRRSAATPRPPGALARLRRRIDRRPVVASGADLTSERAPQPLREADLDHVTAVLWAATHGAAAIELRDHFDEEAAQALADLTTATARLALSGGSR